MDSKGKVWLVGAGPGDSELLTLKARRIIDSADVIVFDRLVGKGILSTLPHTAKLIYVGKQSGNHTVRQENINIILADEAQKGQRVVRLKGGDPFLFGRGAEEMETLIDRNIPFEVIPGVTSSIAVPECAGIPVTHRDYASSVHIITAHKKSGEDTVDYKNIAKLDGTLVFMMGLSSAGKIAHGLIAEGVSPFTPAAAISCGTTAMQKKVISTLETLENDIKRESLISPAVIVVGDVCGLSDKIDTTKILPLSGKCIAVPRHEETVSSLPPILKEMGAQVIEIICDYTEPIPLDNDLFYSLISSGWTVFSSPAAVHAVFAMILEHSVDIRLLWKTKFAAIGSSTKNALASHGIMPDFYAFDLDEESTVELVSKCTPFETRIVVVEGDNTLKNKLLMYLSEAKCKNIPVCRTHILKNYDELLHNTDCVILTSGNIVKAMEKSFDSFDFKDINAVCIGTKTANEAKRLGMNVYMSENSNIKSLIDKLLKY